MTRTCPMCGKDFLVTTHNRKYCSDECAKIANSRNRKRNATIRQCRFCGQDFPAMGTALTCSKECAKAWKEKEFRDRGSRHTGENEVCRICGKPFTIRGPGQKYCSEPCRREAIRINYKETQLPRIREERRTTEPDAPIGAQAALDEERRIARKQRDYELHHGLYAQGGYKKPPKPKPGSLEWAANEATKRGITYGQFIARMEAGTLDD